MTQRRCRTSLPDFEAGDTNLDLQNRRTSGRERRRNEVEVNTEQDDHSQNSEADGRTGLIEGDLILDSALKRRDQDKFGHTEIAEIVAELAGHVEMPVNIALFGPWGSGKSSLFELIRSELEERNGVDGFPVVKAISYDAWKFSGTPLKRTFITNAADQLGLGKGQYRSDLYENRSSFELPIKRVLKDRNLVRRAVATGIFLAVLVALSGTLSAFADIWVDRSLTWRDYGSEWFDRMRALGRWAIIAFVPFVGGLSLLDYAKVTVTRSAPREDEEFHSTFERLMTQALSSRETWWEKLKRKVKGDDLPQRWERVFVFVDELDRCAPDDVLETLIGIKTFLEHDRCVFVVAADRDVLVEALNRGPGDKARQATPVRQHEPYYSTAGAFLDKMFQHQLELPTLRRHKLAVFAKQLVEEQTSGIWKEFSPTELEDIIYTLIPLHVRSPRRVKVLLNAFATNARIADARDVEWRDNPAKLAKLVVLRTEFPVFANDLQLEPKLVTHLENREPPTEDAPSRLVDFYDNYTLGTELEAKKSEPKEAQDGRTVDPEPEVTPASQVVGSDNDGELLRRTQITINAHLLDYLEKTKYGNVAGPSRTLLHLEAAGKKEGLQDEALADVIDDAADRDPDRTLELFQYATDSDRALAARILGSQIEEQVGAGKRSVVETVCRLVEQLKRTDVEGVAPAIAPDIMRAVGSSLGTAAMIPGALALGAARTDASGLKAALDRYEILVNDQENLKDLRLAAAADQLEGLPEVQRSRAAQIITGAMHRATDEGVVRILATVSPAYLTEYWEGNGQEIRERLASRLSSAASAGEELDPAITFDIMLNPLLGRDEYDAAIVADVLWETLLAGAEHYPYVLDRARQHLPGEDAQDVESGLALAALAVAPLTDIGYWLALVDTEEAEADHITAALTHILEEVDLTKADHLKAFDEAAEALLPLLDEEERSVVARQVVEAVPKLLDGFGFGPTELQARRSLDATLRRFEAAAENVHDELMSDQVLTALDQPYDGSNTAVIVAYVNLDLSEAAITLLLEELRGRHADSPQTPQAFRALAATQGRAGDIKPIPVAVYDQLQAAHNDPLIASAWLATKPPVAEVTAQYNSGQRFRTEPIGNYARLLNPADRTILWLELVNLRTADESLAGTLTSVATGGVELSPINPIFDNALQGSTDSARRTAVDLLVTLPLGSGDLLDRATQLIEALLRSDIKGNVPLAADIAIAARGAKPGSKRDIRTLFNAKSKHLSSGKQHLALSEFNLVNLPPVEKLMKFLGGKK